MRSVLCLFFNPMGWLVSHLLVIFCLLVHHLKFLTLPFISLYLGVHHIRECFKNNRGGGQKHINLQEYKARHKEQRKQIRVTFQNKLVVGYWKLVPMVSGDDNVSEQDTYIVTKDSEEPSAKQKRTLQWKE